MNENEKNPSLTEDEEISLIDLFAVLIKHRILIVAGTIAAFILAVLYLFALPKLDKDNSNRNVTMEYRISVTQLPVALEQEISTQKNLGVVKSMAESQFLDIISVVEEIKNVNPFTTEKSSKLEGYKYNSFVKGLMKEKKYEAKAATVRNEIVLTITVPESNIDLANRFVQNLTSKNNKELEDFFFPTIEAFKKSRKNAYDSLTASGETAGKSDIQTVLLMINQIDEFYANYSGFLNCSTEPFIIPEPLGRVKKTIIVTFAAFFILVFVAFVLNAVDNIKQDPEASEKIKSAWDGGKIGKKK